ncbi:metallophosphoesterase family protein [Termitidicoccus mucosus]|uniref:Metallophosphoesterase n=1 Tax=Termitidicoccus mucosus TaxID=1184151 RepID=A0A178IM07_9BACT|nr:hypothetical protein AW736_10030 [Opitutaceae bacterium TSB47]
MQKFIRLFSLVLLLAAPLAAHENHDHDDWNPVRYSDAEAHAPTPLPDRIILTWAGDTATTQAVTWRTNTSVRRGLAEIALANNNGRALQPARVDAVTTAFTSDLNEAHYHSVQFTGLEPATLYAYRVGDGANWSEWFHFRTASRERRPFTFIYFGDAQNDIKTHWSRVFREAFRDAPRAAFTLHAGDLINEDASDAEWGEWHGAPAWVNATIPVIATPGNHEYYNENSGSKNERRWTTKNNEIIRVTREEIRERDAAGETTGYRIDASSEDGRHTAAITLDAKERITGIDAGMTALTGYTLADLSGAKPDKSPLRDRIDNPGTPAVSRHWRPQFTFPEQGAPAGLEETCYYIDYQGARIISLDSSRDRAGQVAWLRQVLQANPQRWTIITFHHPVFSPARGRDNPELRQLWKPVFDEFKVDLVLTGHDHTYARSGDLSARSGYTNVPSGMQAYDAAIGTVYVVSVSGPKMYNITNEIFVRTAEDTQLYQIIMVDYDEIRYEARTATGNLYDAFALKKRGAGQPNELREVLPPPNRRPADTP